MHKKLLKIPFNPWSPESSYIKSQIFNYPTFSYDGQKHVLSSLFLYSYNDDKKTDK